MESNACVYFVKSCYCHYNLETVSKWNVIQNYNMEIPCLGLFVFTHLGTIFNITLTF